MTEQRHAIGLEPTVPPRVLTVDEAAKILRISRSLAFAAIHAGDIPHVRIGRRILVPAHRLRELLGDDTDAQSPEVLSDPIRPQQHRAGTIEDSRQAALRALSASLEALIADRENT